MLTDLRILSKLTLMSNLSVVTHMTGRDDAELTATIERLRREHEHLEISAEVLIERRVFVAKGRDGGHPWLVLSSGLANDPLRTRMGGYSSPRAVARV
jgi:hypothetical protein